MPTTTSSRFNSASTNEAIGRPGVDAAAGPGLTRPEQRGRAIGAMVLAVFAFSWTGWGLSSRAYPALERPVQAASALCLLIVLAAVLLSWRRAARLPAGEDPATGRAAGRRFGIIVAIEFGGIFLLASVLGRLGLVHLIPAAVCLGVGLHFFPLARLFHVRLYDLTGTALCLLAAVTVVVVPFTGQSALWTAVPGLGSAICLYATCAILLGRSALHPHAPTH